MKFSQLLNKYVTEVYFKLFYFKDFSYSATSIKNLTLFHGKPEASTTYSKL